MNYWLMKSEPDVFSIDDLKNRPKQTEPWDGVRNYQARNMLRDDMKKDDLALFYHSSCEVPGIVGIMEIVKEGYPDPTAFIPKHKYYDPKSKPEKPTWYLVDVKFKR
ncbi:MAG: EVE domain-containing protein, partial [Gammaproteobacteria bacterium RIFCSPLOWO2_02_47_7]